MQIFVDADACPVVGIVEKVAKEHDLPVTLLCDTNHVLSSDYSGSIFPVTAIWPSAWGKFSASPLPKTSIIPILSILSVTCAYSRDIFALRAKSLEVNCFGRSSGRNISDRKSVV